MVFGEITEQISYNDYNWRPELDLRIFPFEQAIRQLDDYVPAKYGDGHIYIFGVGSLTWDGCEFLDKIRSDTVWNKTKDVVKKKGLPLVLDVVKDVASAVISSMTEGAIRAAMQQ